VDTRKIIKTKGIVLAETNFSEADKMLTVLTPDLGKISCVAKGARRLQNKLMPISQVFAFSDMILYRGKNDSYYINSAELIESFYSLRIDYDKLENAMACVKFIKKNVQENQSSLLILKLLLNTIYLLSVGDKNSDLVKEIYELKATCLLGFSPRVNACVECGDNNTIGFSMKKNGMVCKNCGIIDKSLIELKSGTIATIKYIVNSDLKKLFSFNITEDIVKELQLFNKIYLQEKLE